MAKISGGPIKNLYLNIVLAGVGLLKEKQGYSQLDITEKLAVLGFRVSVSALSKMVQHHEGGNKILKTTADGVKELIFREMGLQWKENGFSENPEAGWSPTIVAKPGDAINAKSGAGFLFHEDGRLPIGQKVDFFSEAQQEVIEFGVVLNTFAGYFFSRNEKEFKQHVERLLKKGVHFKCYLLDPDAAETSMYFNDRARHLPDEKKSIGKIKEAMEKLLRVQQQFREAGYKGNFEIYTYKNIPNNYFMTVDGDSQEGRMMVSHYIYGESRANCPVLEFSKSSNPFLYDRYWASLRKLAENARPITS